MHPELFLLLYQQRERELEQLHARRAAAAERFELTGATVAPRVTRTRAVSAAVTGALTGALTGLAGRLRTVARSSSPVAVGPDCCPAF